MTEPLTESGAPLQTDVAIVGAGPAGSATALALVQRDRSWAGRLLLIDRAHHPRHKLCGGAITPLGLEVLEKLGLELEVPHRAPPEMRIRFGGIDQRCFPEPALRIVHRAELDAWLLHRAEQDGVRLLQGCAVTDATLDGGTTTLRAGPHTVLARVVVGADGSRGPMRRLLGLSRAGQLARLLEVFTPIGDDERAAGLDRVARFDFDAMRDHLQGYCWDFPCMIDGEPAMNRGVFDARVRPERSRESLPRVLGAHLQRRGLSLAQVQLEGHPIRWFDPESPIARRGALLVGDAAGVDPLLGEGISFALQFGRVAAATIDSGFARDDLGFGDYTGRVARDPVLARLRTRHRRARLLYGRRPGLVTRALWRLGPAFMRAVYS